MRGSKETKKKKHLTKKLEPNTEGTREDPELCCCAPPGLNRLKR